MIDLSIVIVSWNTKKYLLHCVESIFQKREGVPWEVVVVDNGSQDGSGAALKKNFPPVHLIENDRNLGFSKAANQGLKKSSGRYVLLLNPDTQAGEGVLERLTSFMEAHPEAGVAGAQLLNSDGSKQNSIANFPSLATELLNKSLLRWIFPKSFPGKERGYPEPIEVDSVIGACMMVRREAMEQVGLLDEDYFLFLEETDWCYRMKKGGWKIYHVPEAEIYHFQGKTVNLVKGRARIEYYRSLYLFFKKHRKRMHSVTLKSFLFVRFCGDLLLMILACLLTAFTVERLKRKLAMYARLIYWHLRLFPDGMGLQERWSGQSIQRRSEED